MEFDYLSCDRPLADVHSGKMGEEGFLGLMHTKYQKTKYITRITGMKMSRNTRDKHFRVRPSALCDTGAKLLRFISSELPAEPFIGINLVEHVEAVFSIIGR